MTFTQLVLAAWVLAAPGHAAEPGTAETKGEAVSSPKPLPDEAASGPKDVPVAKKAVLRNIGTFVIEREIGLGHEGELHGALPLVETGGALSLDEVRIGRIAPVLNGARVLDVSVEAKYQRDHRVPPGRTNTLDILVEGDLPVGTSTTTLLLTSSSLAQGIEVPVEIRIRRPRTWLLAAAGLGAALQWLYRVFRPWLDSRAEREEEIEHLRREIHDERWRRDAEWTRTIEAIDRTLRGALPWHSFHRTHAEIESLRARYVQANLDLDRRRKLVVDATAPLLAAMGAIGTMPGVVAANVATCHTTLKELRALLSQDDVGEAARVRDRLEDELRDLADGVRCWRADVALALSPLGTTEAPVPPQATALDTLRVARGALDATALATPGAAPADVFAAAPAAHESARRAVSHLGATLEFQRVSLERRLHALDASWDTARTLAALAEIPRWAGGDSSEASARALVAYAKNIRMAMIGWIDANREKGPGRAEAAKGEVVAGTSVNAMGRLTDRPAGQAGQESVVPEVPPRADTGGDTGDVAEPPPPAPAGAGAGAPVPAMEVTVPAAAPTAGNPYISRSRRGLLLETGLSFALLGTLAWATWAETFVGGTGELFQIFAFGLGANLGMDALFGAIAKQRSDEEKKAPADGKAAPAADKGAAAKGAAGEPNADKAAADKAAADKAAADKAAADKAAGTPEPAPASDTAPVVPVDPADPAVTDWDHVGGEEPGAATPPGADLGLESVAPPRVETPGRVWRFTDAAWAADVDSVDYAHLKVAADPAPFALTPDVLERLCAANHFPAAASGLLLFGLRGCTTVATPDGAFAPSVQVREVTPDHLHPRCVVGVWDRAGGQLAVFRGSTVPDARHMAAYANGGDGCNQRLTGFYWFTVGTHMGSVAKPELWLPGALRHFGRIGVSRSRGDMTFTNQDPVVLLERSDNLHCSWSRTLDDTIQFNSAGCVTVHGSWDKVARAHLDPRDGAGWATFRERAGISPRVYGASGVTRPKDGSFFPFVLLTGREAHLAAGPTGAPARLRYGSKGDAVKALQQGIGLTGRAADGAFGWDTLERFTRWQDETFGTRDGIVRPGDRGVDF